MPFNISMFLRQVRISKCATSKWRLRFPPEVALYIANISKTVPEIMILAKLSVKYFCCWYLNNKIVIIHVNNEIKYKVIC